MNRAVINPCHGLTFQASHTAAFNKQIFQHRRFPSVASAYGCMTDTKARFTHGRINIGRCWTVDCIFESESRRPWISSAVCALFKSALVIAFKLQTEDTETILSVQYSVSMVVWVAASENARKEATVTKTTCFRIPGLATFSENKGPRPDDGETFSLRDAFREISCRRNRDCGRNEREAVCEN